MIVANNGAIEVWGSNLTTTQLFNYYKPYLKIMKNCRWSNMGCFSRNNLKGLNGNNLGISFDSYGYYMAQLSDGVSIMFRPSNSTCELGKTCFYFWVDIDGPQKGNNQLGKDLFYFGAYSYGNDIMPIGIRGSFNKTDKKWDNYILPATSVYQSCASGQDGHLCAAKIMKDNWQIKDNYPW